MAKFSIRFSGRKLGAIGDFYETTEMVEAPDVESAILELYQKHEHISRPQTFLMDEDGTGTRVKNSFDAIVEKNTRRW